MGASAALRSLPLVAAVEVVDASTAAHGSHEANELAPAFACVPTAPTMTQSRLGWAALQQGATASTQELRFWEAGKAACGSAGVDGQCEAKTSDTRHAASARGLGL